MSREAEQATLGGLIMDNQAIWRMTLDGTDFGSQDHRTIYETILSMAHQNKPVDAMTLATELENTHKLDAAGGMAYIVTLAKDLPSAANVDAYADIVLRASQKRRAMKSLQAGLRDLHEGSDSAQTVTTVQTELEAIYTHRGGNVVGMGEACRALETQTEEWRKAGDYGLDFGKIPTLNRRVRLRGKKFVVIAARPSLGKTALANQIACAAGVRGVPVGCIHLEMTPEEMAARSLAWRYGLNNTRLYHGDPDEWREVRQCEATSDNPLSEWLVYSDHSATRCEEIIARGLELHRRYKIRALVVDHLHKVKLPGRGRADVEYGAVSQALYELTKRLNIPVVLLAQLNRELDKSDRAPRFSDLRECGALEQDADVIIFLHGDREIENETRRVEIIVAKNRGGVVSSLGDKFLFHGPHQRITEIGI